MYMCNHTNLIFKEINSSMFSSPRIRDSILIMTNYFSTNKIVNKKRNDSFLLCCENRRLCLNNIKIE